VRLYCKRHPKYKGDSKVRVNCGGCRAIYYLMFYWSDLREQRWGHADRLIEGMIFGRRPKDAKERA
jgi:hypothetical protein